MTRCLERVLASDYKKLEIVVFDDSSNDNTSIIVKSFAQAGVRFVEGMGVPEGWLGKNYALDVLAREASGTYVMLMDVDTAITPTTISRLVAYMATEHAAMVSVIPERADGWRLSVLFGYLRYFWELTIRGGRNPAAASALWMIDRHKLLNDLGGLVPLKSTAAPESAVAAVLGSSEYRCLISGEELRVMYEKKWTSQVEAGRRLLFPKVGGSLGGAVVAVFGLALLNVPFITLLGGFFFGWTALQLAASLVILFSMAMYGLYTKHVWRRAWLAGAFLWPVIVAQELLLLLASLWGYWRHTITWKGRPVSPSPVPSRAGS
jgi:glycosyltransferase involved in cell wall biosynthesis